MSLASAPIVLTHPRFTATVLAEAAFVAECGGPARLADDLVVALGERQGPVLPMRFAFHHGRGEDYQLHIAYLFGAPRRISVRRFRAGDPVAAEVRVRRGTAPLARVGKQLSHV